MAPALTKILKDGHGIHLSSLPASIRVDSDKRPVHNTELDPQMRLTENSDLQKMWNNLSLFASLDPCLPLSLLDVSADAVLSPRLQVSASDCETVLPPSPASSFSLLSINKGPKDSHQVVPILPGVSDMFLGLVPEHNSQEAYLLQGSGDASECGPYGSDVMCHSSFTHSSVSSSYSLEVKSQGYNPLSVPPPTMTQEKGADMGCLPPAPMQRCSGRMNFDHLVSRAALEKVLKDQLYRQAGLQSRALKLQKRLQALLVEHTLLHCNQQLEGLKSRCLLGDVTHDSLDSLRPGILPPKPGGNPHFSWSSTTSWAELREFSCSSQAVLRSLQEALDSEATASSSSDDESEEDNNHVKMRASPVSSSERQWLEERAELGSRWSWLQLRLVDVEGRIQQLVELHKHICTYKGSVVLAESQPLTDRQIQQSLLGQMGGFSCTATDVDTEACSPSSLLHNIERQSAQLSHIVNSLMPPLSFSPLSKQPQTWNESIFKSGQKADKVFEHGSSKRRRLGNRRLFKADVSCVCARTRPLVTYHKPRLFTFNTHILSSPQVSGQSTFTFSSSFSPSSCSCCSSCDRVVLCSAADCSSSWALSSRNPSSRPHPMLSLSFDTALSHHLQGSLAREEQQPAPAHYSRYSSTRLHNSHKYKRHARRQKRKVMGLSSIRRVGSAQSKHRAKQRKKKRKPIQQLNEDEEHSLYQLYDQQESSDEVLEESYRQVSHNQAAQNFVRKRQGESVYNINNIFIPMSLPKVEKLQYKDIATPSWRMVDILTESEAESGKDSEQWQIEDLSDDVFAQRHLTLEKGEKLHWSFWGERKCCRLPKRSGSRLSGSGGAMCTSGEESSVDWSSAQLDTDEQPSSEEWLPPTPWEPRVFPLGKEEEETLLSENLENIPSEWPELRSSSSTSKNSNCQLPLARSSGFTPPSGGQSWTFTPSGS
ncbi:KAT8 regulatory NSL complex subunit 1-like protein MSL1v2 [Channa argus]|uniref:KAT8 regulatory NSL complex subunit 1-like protein MSL1v2 n=1 Tax=Channa argus TaxID=215402 RepID=A0A6G1PXM9_CHAAH|nr:KAT8 regulatory NSL complex subunit 1-like protein MSL1v2 [Channa argus]